MEWLATAIRTYKGQASVVQVQGFDDLSSERAIEINLGHGEERATEVGSHVESVTFSPIPPWRVGDD